MRTLATVRTKAHGPESWVIYQAVVKGDPYGAQSAAASIGHDAKAMSSIDTSQLDHNAYVDGLLSQIRSYESEAGIG